ncbi:SPOC domain-containing protein [Hirschfeldia incana]|nr:SPOC domain-containing protein [Hirschfeldia incana]
MSNNVLPQSLPVSMQMGPPSVDVCTPEPNCNYQEAPSLPEISQISGRQDCNVIMQSSFVPNGAIAGSVDTSKRKTPLHPPPLAVQNKRMAPNRAWASELNKGPKSASVSPKTQFLPASSLCKSASFSCNNKPGKPTSTARKQVSQPLKPQNESSNIVRSKMRESLASALAMVQRQKEATEESKVLPSGETVTNSVEGLVCEPESADSGVGVMVSNGGGISVQTAVPEILTMAKTSDTEDFSFSDNVLGNDLSWDLLSDIEFTESSQNEMTAAAANGGSQEKLLLDPKVLAFKIEAELFKLFGGVNKKYKEKGRSLLFNLKDKSNPKLREKVMYGEIAAERLCSMSAEELASKELAEWRQAKAEEMAQMVVLQDTEVDIRSLVRKTHKGEFQVEVEPMDSGSVEISVGSSSLNWSRPKNIKKKTLGAKNGLSNTSEDSALVNGVIVDDVMQAATGSLPPIVSLDEFVSSIDSESPSESDIGKGPPGSENYDAEANIDLGTSPVKAEDDVLVSSMPHSDLKSVSVPAGERLWEGALQLSVSSVISVIGILKSGEKTTTKEWPVLLEIKGRVRLDAFEKFVRELPNSRSRAVMVMCFVCKEDCSKTEQETISEVVDSYVKDGRVGFAEPVSGVELYLCPTRGRTTEILSKIVPRNQLHFLKSLDDDGLIGVVVWRRPQFNKPPQSYSHKNHGSSLTTLNTSRHYGNMPQVNHDDGGDVPPGFGPMAVARRDDDDDDLPEFNYLSRGDVVMNRTSRSVSVRELILKYGKSEPLWNQGFNNYGHNVILPERQPQPNPTNVNGGSMVRPRSEWWTHQAGGY